MGTKCLIVVLFSLFWLMFPLVSAATITSVVFDKTVYVQGDSGYVKVVVFNEAESKIRVTGVEVTFDYYYDDGPVYLQKFFTNATLPVEIEAGQLETLFILFTLPTYIASGYVKSSVKVEYDEWSPVAERWLPHMPPLTYNSKLYVESPYKKQYEDLVIKYGNANNIMYALVAATIIFLSASIYFGTRYYSMKKRKLESSKA